MKLIRYEEFAGFIRNVEGLRIGGTTEGAGIGEVDNPVIRHPITLTPYIPGSSLKGKLRSLLEQKYSPRTQETGRPCDCANPECFICSLFGCGDPTKSKAPTRIIMRDASLTEDSQQELSEALPGSFVEVKTETAINRNTGGVQRGSLRPTERIPAGMKFDFRFCLRVFEEDVEQLSLYYERLAEALDMLEKDYLGGSGTRGYGQVTVVAEDGSTPMAEHLRQKAKESVA